MKVLDSHDLELHYVVLKIGGITLSTKYMRKDSGMLKLQKTKSKTGGVGDNIWLKTILTEGSKHQPLSQPIEIELNIYNGG